MATLLCARIGFVLHLSIRPRCWLTLLLGVFLSCCLSAADGWRDPEFDKVPFADWLAGGPQTQLKWSERIQPVILSVHQRLLARLQIQLDGAEAAKRRGEGKLMFYFQITDSKGRVYQDHTAYDLEKVEAGLKAQDLVCTESVFVLPGDYLVALGIYDTATKEHAVKKGKLHVPPMKIEPLPDAWRDLPPVEFVEAVEPPDRWFAPKVQGKLNLPVAPKHPVQIDVILNLTPSESGRRPFGAQDRNFSVLIPSLKVLSQLNAPNVSLNVSLLDVSRRRVVFHQEDIHELDWDKMKSSLSDATSGSIDVKSLADRRHNGAFFVKEVARRVAPGHVVIVLSGPMVFDSEQELPGDLKASPDSHLYYLRAQSAPSRRTIFGGPGAGPPRGGTLGRARMPGGEQTFVPLESDQLEPMLKPLDPKLFDVLSAEQFRKALATMISEIGSL